MSSIKKKSLKIWGSSPPPLEPPPKFRGVATPLPLPTLAPLVEATLLAFSILSSGNKMDSLASTVLQDNRLTGLHSIVYSYTGIGMHVMTYIFLVIWILIRWCSCRVLSSLTVFFTLPKSVHSFGMRPKWMNTFLTRPEHWRRVQNDIEL